MLLAVSLVLKAFAAALLVRIGWLDFTTQKIANRDVLLLLFLGVGSLQLISVATGSWWDMGLSALASLALLIGLFPFWSLGKVGAGDVKLMAVTPILVGSSSLFLFSLLLLFFALVTALLVKNPFLLPEGAFRVYVQHFDRKGVVPFGVPISAAAICTAAFQIAYSLDAMAGSPL
ncbi:prepilin peptidase [Mesorhizobium sp. WSM3862]|uniref:prepilin peptidase n=1 Tax=Mesorhizobium sp. WSM3862 TaxID=632858 RepID=UPI000BAEB4EF|nr:prepilin peptidase [Mesorhizobium sp. WSM3862]PBB94781.1 prepilin peptidase [Mesorhizobium sp. WSM3862]